MPTPGAGELVVRVRAVAVNPVDAITGQLRRPGSGPYPVIGLNIPVSPNSENNACKQPRKTQFVLRGTDNVRSAHPAS